MSFKLFNVPYFLKEAGTLARKDLSSYILSILSLSMIFFILSMTAGLGYSMNYMADSLQSEAEISVYYDPGSDPERISEDLQEIEGVEEIKLILADEAKDRMVKLLGDDSKILALFDYNPFSEYLEVHIQLDKAEEIPVSAGSIEGVSYVRDNREVLTKLEDISAVFNLAGLLVIAAVGAATVVLTSHIIRQGIYLNRDAIGTLKLLGAPDGFIYLPFIINGVFLSVLSGILSLGVTVISASRIFNGLTGSLPFLVLPDYDLLLTGLSIFTLSTALLLGLAGSLVGIGSTKPKK